MREREIGRIQAMCRLIRSRPDPALTIGEGAGLVSNESADTTNGEHFRCDEHLPHWSGCRLTSCLSGQSFKSHTPPSSLFSIYARDREQQRGVCRTYV